MFREFFRTCDIIVGGSVTVTGFGGAVVVCLPGVVLLTATGGNVFTARPVPAQA